jgi:hypothetical protein
VCFIALVAVFATVIYGFWLRAIWAHGYYLAVIVGIVGAVVILVCLAQQAIAARDVATWRDMAEWQIRAARAHARHSPPYQDSNNSIYEDAEPHSAAYYEMLIGTLVRHAEDEDTGIHER